MLLYVSGRITPVKNTTIDENIQAARIVAIALWEAGHAVICPHLNTAYFNEDCKVGFDDYIKGDLIMLARCDGIVMLKGWEDSRGAVIEHEYALGLGIPVFHNIPALHPTERNAPKQAQAFAEILGKMYRVHLSKNADYSPANILGAGEIGLVTRLWDKIARLMNLTGFRISINESVFEKPKNPKNESVGDTYLDLATYGVIGLLLREGKWRK